MSTGTCYVWSLSVFLLFFLFIFGQLSIVFFVDNIVLLQLLVVAVFPWLFKWGHWNWNRIKCCNENGMGLMVHKPYPGFLTSYCCWPESWQDVRCRIAHSSPLHSWCSSLDDRTIEVMLGCSSATELGEHPVIRIRLHMMIVYLEKKHIGETCFLNLMK